MRKITALALALFATILVGCSHADDAPSEPAAATQGGNVIKAPAGLNSGPTAAGGGTAAPSAQ